MLTQRAGPRQSQGTQVSMGRDTEGQAWQQGKVAVDGEGAGVPLGRLGLAPLLGSGQLWEP